MEKKRPHLLLVFDDSSQHLSVVDARPTGARHDGGLMYSSIKATTQHTIDMGDRVGDLVPLACTGSTVNGDKQALVHGTRGDADAS
jgi:hypothetical protein